MRRETGSGKARAGLLLFLTASLLSICAVLLLREAFVDAEGVPRVLFAVGGVLASLFGAVLWLSLAFAVASGERRNFFLYDGESKTNRPVGALDLASVRCRLDEAFRAYLQRGKLFPPILPLLSPYLLLVFLDSASERDLRRLLSGTSATRTEMAEGLLRLGLSEPARILLQADRDGAPESVRGALSCHRASVETALLAYVREHIGEFDL